MASCLHGLIWTIAARVRVFGGYAFYLPKGYKHHSLRGLAGHFIYRILQIADVEKWDQLVGKTIRVRQDNGEKNV